MSTSGDYLRNLVIRRSDQVDSKQVEELASSAAYGEAARRVFGQELDAVKMIECSYLSVTVASAEGSVIAFAVFDDHPPGLHSNDRRHENFWEIWLRQARGLNDDFNSNNTLWLTYFIVGDVEDSLVSEVFTRILQSAYYTLPTISQTLLLIRGEAEDTDLEAMQLHHLEDKFEELELHNRDILSSVRGVHFNSKFWLSIRAMVIPRMEIRTAREEDHDNLAAVFNSQSDVITDTYGDYFLAELIAAQSETSRSLVAQVDDKAVGMLTITSEIDTQLLWQCFELDAYDNLFDPLYMDVVREKRAEIVERRRVEAEERAREEARRLRKETMVCYIIAQRIALQEFLKERAEEIFAQMEEIMKNPDNYQQMNKRSVNELIKQWLREFQMRQPSEYFLDHPSDDPTLVCNILTDIEFFIDCLEFFGLPENYMEGQGHFHDWYRAKEEENKQTQAQRGALYGKNRGKHNVKRGDRRAQEEFKAPDPPEYYDLEPLKKAIRLFIDADSDARTRFRQDVKRYPQKLEYCFRKDDGTVDSNMFHVNTTNFSLHLENAGFSFEPNVAAVLGPMLRCFGLLNTRNEHKTIQPPQPVEEEKKTTAKNTRSRAKAQQEKEQKVQTSMEIECGVIVEFQKNKEMQLIPANVTLMKTSLNEVLKAVELIEDYDKTLYTYDLIVGEELKNESEEHTRPQKRNTFDDDEEESDRAPSVEPSVHEEASEIQQVEEEASEDEDNLDKLYKRTVEDLDDLENIPEPPEIAKNAFCLVLYCLDEAFEGFGIEFLDQAFEQFPNRDYMVITQPHTVLENSVMKFFTHVPKKPNNTFSHVLYIMHRDCLYYQNIEVLRTEREDLELVEDLINASDYPEEVKNAAEHSLSHNDSPYVSFTIRCKGSVIGLYVVSKDINLRYYQSHFQIENHVLLDKHRREGHTRLFYGLINPIFLKTQNLIMRDILRLMDKTCLYFEIHDLTVIPSVFHDLIYTRSRKFPHFLQKPWEHEKALRDETDGQPWQDGINRNYQDEQESDFALALITKKDLSLPKLAINHRIVVVGASDTALSFLESLLSNNFLQFNNLYLVAPGGLPYYHISSESENLKSSSTNYSIRQQIRLLLENRVSVIDDLMTDIDRENKRIFLHDDSVIKFDFLVLAMGLQDCTLQKMGRVSRGIAPVPEDKKYHDGILSIDDPYLFQHFRPEGNLMAMLNHRKMPGTTVIYGYTLHAYCCIQGLIAKGINPQRIKLVLCTPVFEEEEGLDPLFGGDANVLVNHDAFEHDQAVSQKVHAELASLGVEVFPPSTIIDVATDEKNNLAYVKIRTEEDEEIKVSCKVIVTAGMSDIDERIFSAIHNNGLVFNGRIIVNHQFLTTDESIFAAGSLCEFSQQYKHTAPGRCLRMDRYNGKEIGISLAKSVLSFIDLQDYQEEVKDELPVFFMPRGKGGTLPGGYFYYYIEAPKFGEPKAVRESPKNRPDVVSDTLREEEGKVVGHYIKFTFNNYGIVESATYLSKQSIEVQALWRFVGLSETYLNKLSARFDNLLLPDVTEFLSENWAMALYHDLFPDFSAELKNELSTRIGEILEAASELALNAETFSREQIEKMKDRVPRDTRRMIQEATIKYIKSNLNHMPMYYIPGVEFP